MSQVSIHPRVDLSSQINAILINEMPVEDSSLFDAALHHFKTPGKAFRANLALSSGLALNLKPDSFIYWAAACELLHNASLVCMMILVMRALIGEEDQVSISTLERM